MLKVGDKVIAVVDSEDGVFKSGAIGTIVEVCEGMVPYLIHFTKGEFNAKYSGQWWAYAGEVALYKGEDNQPTTYKWNSPTLEEVESIVTNMPGGLDGFLSGWGWFQFAREVEKLCKEKNA